MAIDSSSSVSQIVAEYVDNCSYDDGNGSVAMALAFKKACRVLLLKMPAMSSHDRAVTQLSPGEISKQLERVSLWLALNPATAGGGTGRYFATDEFRDTSIGTPIPDPGGSP